MACCLAILKAMMMGWWGDVEHTENSENVAQKKAPQSRRSDLAEPQGMHPDFNDRERQREMLAMTSVDNRKGSSSSRSPSLLKLRL